MTVSAMAVLDLRKARVLKKAQERKARMWNQARHWPVAEGFVLHTRQSREGDGVLRMIVTYMYKVQDEEFVGSDAFAFTNENDAKRFESRCREQKLKVHYQQDKPEVCVLVRDEMR